MSHFIPKWSNVFWNLTGVTSIDSYSNKWHVMISILLVISCVFNIYITPKSVCDLEGSCDNSLSTQIKGLFMRTVAVSCLISKIMAMRKGKTELILFQKNIEKFHIITPMTHAEIKVLNNLSFILIISSLLLTAPANYVRILDIISFESGSSSLAHAFKYIQNFSMYCVETHFTILCFVLYHKFVDINRDLMALKIDTIVRNKYPFMTRSREKYGNSTTDCDYNREVLHFLAAGHPMIDFIERLKSKHKLVREATKNLNELFGIHLGLSICSLCLYTMFDLYYFFIGIMSLSNYTSVIYSWILQYVVRFGSVTILAHLTSKEAIKSKILITDINNRFLDTNTKGELQMFLSQISNCVIEFTACEFFTLNTHLITSAVAACSTHLIILLQFNFIQYSST